MIIAHKCFYSIFGNVKADVNKWYWVYIAYKIQFSSPIKQIPGSFSKYQKGLTNNDKNIAYKMVFQTLLYIIVFMYV